jgi:hypothetical protein
MSSQKSDLPIDAVITWVDGNDPVHRSKLEACLGRRSKNRPKAAAKTRYANNGELKYCLASLLRFAPWIGHIYIVTDNQIPDFMGALPTAIANRITVVDHQSIFDGFTGNLPTFNSLTIETMLWRIPGLADNFIYFNDDVFLIKPVVSTDFFKGSKVVLRGTFRPREKRRLFRRLAQWLGKGRPTVRRLQSDAAGYAGFADQYLSVEHIPHPMRVSTLRDYFASHSQQLQSNVAFRLRDVRQFWTVALANHLEIKQDSADFSKLPDFLCLSSSACVRDIESLLNAEKQPDCKFLCVQSLDGSSEEFMTLWTSWMEKNIGGLVEICE